MELGFYSLSDWNEVLSPPAQSTTYSPEQRIVTLHNPQSTPFHGLSTSEKQARELGYTPYTLRATKQVSGNEWKASISTDRWFVPNDLHQRIADGKDLQEAHQLSLTEDSVCLVPCGHSASAKSLRDRQCQICGKRRVHTLPDQAAREIFLSCRLKNDTTPPSLQETGFKLWQYRLRA